jgi:hypothetical protein
MLKELLQGLDVAELVAAGRSPLLETPRGRVGEQMKTFRTTGGALKQ